MCRGAHCAPAKYDFKLRANTVRPYKNILPTKILHIPEAHILFL